VGHDVEAMDRRPFVFGRRRMGVVKRPSAMEVAGGVGGAGAFGALASTEEEVQKRSEKCRWRQRVVVVVGRADGRATS
jgi:hypothetical protein